QAFLGDVVTHELGHFLGLAHSETPGSTMVYSVFKEMHTVASDDIHGIKELYGPASGGKITGKIVGGKSVGVFGVNVFLISHDTGKIAAHVMSDSSGN